RLSEQMRRTPTRRRRLSSSGRETDDSITVMKSSLSRSVKLKDMSTSPRDEPAAIEVDVLDATAAGDREQVERLTGLVNRVYAASEVGLGREGSTRTTTAEMAGLVAAGQIAVATVDGEVAGAIHVQTVSDDAGEFGLLAADSEYRGIGVGRAL